MLEHALHYAAIGWPVFPCGKDKKPLSPHGFKDATTDEVVLSGWWTRWPDAMIGLPTGFPSGIWAVDCDGSGKGTAEFEQFCAANGGLVDTLYQDTPSGGRHYLFQWTKDAPVRNTVKKLCPHVDTRGEGGYIVLAPSVRADGNTYVWGNPEIAPQPAPMWLIKRIIAKPENSPSLSPYAQAALNAEAEKVAAASEGERNNTLNTSAFAIGTLVGGGKIPAETARDALFQAATKAGLNEREAMLTIQSGLDAGAERPRFNTSQRLSISQPEQDYVITWADLVQRNVPFEPAVEGLFDQGEVVQINARSGTGKGFITMQLALEMGAVPESLNGIDLNEHLLWGRFRIPKMRRTLFIQSENRTARTRQKLLMMLAQNAGLERALPNVGFYSYDNVDIRTSGSFMEDAYFDRLLNIISCQHYETLVFDPLVNFLDVDENDNRQVNHSLQRLIDFQKHCEATIIIVHHMGKSQDLDGRGASAIRAKADTMISFVRDKNKQLKEQKDTVILTGHFEKIRHAHDGYSVDFSRTDGEFLLRPISDEERSAKDSEDIDRVVAMLKGMGGECGSVAALQDALADKHGVTKRTAASWVSKARDAGVLKEHPVNGRQKGYSLVENTD